MPLLHGPLLLRGVEVGLLVPVVHLPLDAAVDQSVGIPLLAARGGIHDSALMREFCLVETQGHRHLHCTAGGLIVAICTNEAALLNLPSHRLSIHEYCNPCIRELLEWRPLALLVVLTLLLQQFLFTAHGGSRGWLLFPAFLDRSSLYHG